MVLVAMSMDFDHIRFFFKVTKKRGHYTGIASNKH